MKTAPFLTAAYLLWWGFETGNIAVSIVLALFAELFNATKKKRHLSEGDFINISDTISLILVAYLVLVFFLYPLREAPYHLVEWLPIINIPLLFAQFISTGNSVVIGTRFGGKKKRPHAHQPLNFSFLFFGMIIFSAATGSNRGGEFFIILITLILLTFLPFRSRRFPLPLFVIAGILAVALSIGGNRGYLKAHSTIKAAMMRWAQAYYEQKYANFSKVTTALGDVGKMKLSGKIVMRVKSKKPPKLMKEAAFTTFGHSIWFHKDKNITKLTAEKTDWIITKKKSSSSPSLHISFNFPRQQGVIPLPYKVARIRNLNVAGIEKNGVGKFFVSEGPPLLDYDIIINETESLDSPSETDLTIPKQDYETLLAIINSFNMAKETTIEERIKIVEKYFNTFSYSLDLQGKGAHKTPLQNFLLNTKQGHCEFFATATVLLLRVQGIPARYAIGYAISEKDRFSDGYIVRERDGHAWAEVFETGGWKVVDTTPASWIEEDAKNASIFEKFTDFINFMSFSYQKYRLTKQRESSLYMIGAILLLSSFLIIRISWRMRKNRVIKKDDLKNREFHDSPFRLIVELIRKRGISKEEHETVQEYLVRASEILSIEMPEQRLFYLHNKLLFDPKGISKIEKAELVGGVAGWIHKLKS
ncbi:hypothetical protein KAH37_00290 [bacterium]|nr:hypothetical protein [bacterium]